MQNNLKIALLQLPYIEDLEVLRRYINTAIDANVKLLALGEYMINPFFAELKNMDPTKVAQESTKRLRLLEEIATQNNITIVAPIIMGASAYMKQEFSSSEVYAKDEEIVGTIKVDVVPKEEDLEFKRLAQATRRQQMQRARLKTLKGELQEQLLYKCVVVINREFVKFYNQQYLIDYSHWNEKEFFANKRFKHYEPLIFSVCDVKIAIVCGYELHFEAVWLRLKKERVDVVILPTASVSSTASRWENLIFARSFFSSCLIARINKIGNHKIINKNEARPIIEEILSPKNGSENIEWNFNGGSLIMSPEGVLSRLCDKEEMLYMDIKLDKIRKIREEWNFYE